MTALPSVGPPQMAEKNLSARLDALAELVRIARPKQGQEGFAESLLDDSDSVLRRAGERLRLSSNHTVVALAGGTGSGKSTLFNALAGASFSPPGVTRPTTRHVHACVWGMQGAAPLLDWLGVQRRHRYARASALDSGESALNGLLLLDLPDHDSVVTASMAAVDRLSKLADMLIWVLDPQKYADAAVHNRYLIPLAGHAGVFTVVLNQIDQLTPEQAKDCEDDLRRLLDAEGLTDTPLLPVSARTGVGLADLRALLMDVVNASHAASERIAADIDAVIGGFAVHAGEQVAPDHALAAAASGESTGTLGALGTLGAPDDAGDQHKSSARPPWEIEEDEETEPAIQKPPWEDATPDGINADGVDPVSSVPEGPAQDLTAAFAGAAGLTAVADALASAREAQAAKFVGWPPARIVRGRRDPVRALRAAAGNKTAADPAAAAGKAQQSEVDNAVTAFADAIGGKLPEPWATSLRGVARSNAAAVPSALAGAVREAVSGGGSGGGAQDTEGAQRAEGAGSARGARVPSWWRLITAWQWLLTVLAVAGLIWAVVIAVAHGGRDQSTLLGDVSLIPWLLVMAAAMLLLGFLTAAGCQNMVLLAADRERERAEQAMRERVAEVARDLVLVPVGEEIAQYERFRRELAVAQGQPQS